jgi:Multicopper oxidase
MSRRSFISSGGACAGAALLNCDGNASLLFDDPPLSNATKVRATMRTLQINGKAATLMGLEQPNGKQGLSLEISRPFDVLLENKLAVPTAIHWHGLHPPNNQDGVPGLTQAPILPNASYRYYFPLKPSGTHWMHSHLGLQEAFLLSAPLIVHEPSDEHADEQEIILFLGDFSFTPPTEIYAKLQKPAQAMAMGSMAHGKAAKPDVNDVDYDAYLANDRILTDPDVVRVEKNGRVRLRIINGSSGTIFFISLGDLEGEVIATDGMRSNRFAAPGSLWPSRSVSTLECRSQRRARFPSSHSERARRSRRASSWQRRTLRSRNCQPGMRRRQDC